MSTDHKWTVIGARGPAEYVGSFPVRHDIPIVTKEYKESHPNWDELRSKQGCKLVYQCIVCKITCTGEDKRDEMESCDISQIRRLMEL